MTEAYKSPAFEKTNNSGRLAHLINFGLIIGMFIFAYATYDLMPDKFAKKIYVK